MLETTYIPVPKESVSDDAVVLSRWLVPDGANIEMGESVAIIETSKATMDVQAPVSGYLFRLVGEGDRIAVGANFAVVSRIAARPETANLAVAAETELVDSRFSKAAKRLLAAHKISPSNFSDLELVRGEDVQNWLDRNRPDQLEMPANLPPAKRDEVLLWGGGGHAKVCIEILRASGSYQIYGIADSKLAVGDRVLGVPVVGSDQYLERFRELGVCKVVLGIGAVKAHASRRKMFERIASAGFEQPTIAHPSAVIDPSARIGHGGVIFANATISSDVSLGNGAIVNSGVVISHDCAIGKNVHLAPGALVAGGVEIGDDTLVGMGATIFLGARIGANVRINNGATVDGDVKSGSVVYR